MWFCFLLFFKCYIQVIRMPFNAGYTVFHKKNVCSELPVVGKTSFLLVMEELLVLNIIIYP